jgi:hypothetical protein
MHATIELRMLLLVARHQSTHAATVARQSLGKHSFTKIGRAFSVGSVLFIDIILVYCENHLKHTNTLYGQNESLF